MKLTSNPSPRRLHLRHATLFGSRSLDAALVADQQAREAEIARLERWCVLQLDARWHLFATVPCSGGMLACHLAFPREYWFLCPFAAYVLTVWLYIKWCNRMDTRLKMLRGER